MSFKIKKYARYVLDIYKNVNSSIIYNSAKWKQPEYLSIEEWINKLWYVFIIAMKKNDFCYVQVMINLTYRVLKKYTT